MTDLISHISRVTQQKWGIAGKSVVPDDESIDIVINFYRKLLEEAEDDRQIETAGLIFRRENGVFSVYARVGMESMTNGGNND